MPTRIHLIVLFFLCLPVFLWAQPDYYYVESSCTGCKLTANGKVSSFELISDQVHPFTMGGNEREIELITADFKAGLAAVYSNYRALTQNVVVRKLSDQVVGEKTRQQQIADMKQKGYEVVNHPFWLASHRAIPGVDEYLSFAATVGFNGVVLIAENDWVVHRRGYGQARVLGKLANSPSVAFPLGTMTKAFTAQAILLLEEAGELKLSDNLGRIFRGSPTDKKTITIRHLLTHTSGLGRDVVLEGEETGKEVLDAILDSKLQALPAAGYHYSNAGYQLLALIIQKITRQPYDEFLKEQILLPFQLKQTRFDHQPPGQALIADGKIALGGEPFIPRSVANYTYLGSDGLIMTADDLFRWFRSLSKLPFFFEMTRPRLDIETSHGFASENKMVVANGKSDGYHAYLSYDPSQRRMIIVLSNSGREDAAVFAETLAGNISKIIDGKLVKP